VAKQHRDADEAALRRSHRGSWPQQFVKVECNACGHTELLSADMLRLNGCPLRSYTGILDLEAKLRCRECDAKGKTVVSIRWADGHS
jgi:hypothetical protein